MPVAGARLRNLIKITKTKVRNRKASSYEPLTFKRGASVSSNQRPHVV